LVVLSGSERYYSSVRRLSHTVHYLFAMTPPEPGGRYYISPSAGAGPKQAFGHTYMTAPSAHTALSALQEAMQTCHRVVVAVREVLGTLWVGLAGHVMVRVQGKRFHCRYRMSRTLDHDDAKGIRSERFLDGI
jgi:hypothetical protein